MSLWPPACMTMVWSRLPTDMGRKTSPLHWPGCGVVAAPSLLVSNVPPAPNRSSRSDVKTTGWPVIPSAMSWPPIPVSMREPSIFTTTPGSMASRPSSRASRVLPTSTGPPGVPLMIRFSVKAWTMSRSSQCAGTVRVSKGTPSLVLILTNRAFMVLPTTRFPCTSGPIRPSVSSKLARSPAMAASALLVILLKETVGRAPIMRIGW